METNDFVVTPVGRVHSSLAERKGAPRQAWDGAPAARIDVDSAFVECLEGLAAGQEIWILTWFHQAQRSVQKVHPRGERSNPLMGVFATRSPDRPNPIGLHRARILSVTERSLEIESLEAIDGTPVLDIKPVLERNCEA